MPGPSGRQYHSGVTSSTKGLPAGIPGNGPVTTIVREYPEDFGPGKEAYYPIPAEDTKIQYAKYAERAEKEKGVTFVGRLATYRYYNMDQVVGMALTEYEKIKNR